MESYQEASEYLGALGERPVPYGSTRGTTLRRLGPDKIAVVYHDSHVVTYHHSGLVSLSGNGWRSSTTKSRINDYSPATVFQHDEWDWFIGTPDGRRVPFFDGITVDAKGAPVMGPDGVPVKDGVLPIKEMKTP